MEKKRFERYALFIELFTGYNAATLLFSIAGTGLLQSLWKDEFEFDGTSLLAQGTPQIFLISSVLILMKAVPRLNTQGSYTLIYVLLVLTVNTMLFFTLEIKSYQLAFMWCVITNVLWVFADGCVLLPMLLSIGTLATHAIIYPTRFGASDAAPYDAMLLGSGFFEVVIALDTIALVMGVNRYYIFVAHTTLDTRASQTGKAVAFSLLSATCDAVVHLSCELVISEPTPKLGALLLRSDSLQGICFVDLFHENEEICLQQSLNSAPGHTGLIRLQLRDADGNSVDVLAYHVTGLDVDDAPYHLLGLKEADPTQHALPEAVPDSFTEVAPIRYGLSAIGEHTSSSSERSSYYYVELKEIAVWFQPFTGDYEVETRTRAFKSYFTDSSQARLQSCLKPRDRTKFDQWLHRALNDEYYDPKLPIGVEEAPAPHGDIATFVFQTRRGSRAMDVEVTLVVDHPGGDAKATQEFEFAKLTMVKSRPRARSRSQLKQWTAL